MPFGKGDDVFVKSLIVLLFSLFIFIDSISVLPRLVASDNGSNALGASLQAMANTVKRFSLVLIAPLLGILAMTDTLQGLVATIMISFSVGTAIFVITTLKNGVFKFVFEELLKLLIEKNISLKRLCGLFMDSLRVRRQGFGLSIFSFGAGNINREVRTLSIFIFTLYVNAVFIINIMAKNYSDISSVLLQTSGVVTALGTILMAFWLDPILARSYDTRDGSYKNVQSLLQGKFISLLLSLGLYTACYFYISG